MLSLSLYAATESVSFGDRGQAEGDSEVHLHVCISDWSDVQ